LFTRTVIDIMLYLNENCRFYNYYGPAECTEAAIVHLVTKDDFIYPSVPLGRPIPNVHVYLRDEYLQHIIPGMHIGEIVIGGIMLYSMSKLFHFWKLNEINLFVCVL
jgi:non-ribosomal peptide synthetase component F